MSPSPPAPHPAAGVVDPPPAAHGEGEGSSTPALTKRPYARRTPAGSRPNYANTRS